MAKARKSRHGARATGGAGAVVLGQNNYGKSRVRLVKVSRSGKRHAVHELTVDISLEGEFGAVHEGDNALCIPTDTMKNTVYALAKGHGLESVESFAVHLGGHFVDRFAHVHLARVRVAQTRWDRASVRGREHPHCFLKGSEERKTCEAAVERPGAAVLGGVEGLVLLKSTGSAFSGYLKDEYTTLHETRDRIMATSVKADWQYAGLTGRGVFGAWREQVRRALIETFAEHESESVQQTLFAMGAAALRACRAIERIRLSLPNKHCLLVNLAPFGLTNPNEIFVPTDEPFGLIEATVERGGGRQGEIHHRDIATQRRGEKRKGN